jgi:hypothetical protein
MSPVAFCFFVAGMASALFMLFCAFSIVVMVINKRFENKHLADNLKAGMVIGGLLFAFCMFATHHFIDKPHSKTVDKVTTVHYNYGESSFKSDDSSKQSNAAVNDSSLMLVEFVDGKAIDTVLINESIVFTPTSSKAYENYYKTVMLSPCLALSGTIKYINLLPQKLEDWIKNKHP